MKAQRIHAGCAGATPTAELPQTGQILDERAKRASHAGRRKPPLHSPDTIRSRLDCSPRLVAAPRPPADMRDKVTNEQRRGTQSSRATSRMCRSCVAPRPATDGIVVGKIPLATDSQPAAATPYILQLPPWRPSPLLLWIGVAAFCGAPRDSYSNQGSTNSRVSFRWALPLCHLCRRACLSARAHSPGSPATVFVYPGVVSASTSTARGAGLVTGVAQAQSVFEIQARDTRSNLQFNLGDASLFMVRRAGWAPRSDQVVSGTLFVLPASINANDWTQLCAACGSVAAGRMRDPEGKKELWSQAELIKLKAAVDRHGRDWAAVSRDVDSKTAHQCSIKVNTEVLAGRMQEPGGKQEPWSQAELILLEAAIARHGRDWAAVARDVGRTNEQCRNKVVFEVAAGRLVQIQGSG